MMNLFGSENSEDLIPINQAVYKTNYEVDKDNEIQAESEFEQLGLCRELSNVLALHKITQPTQIQSQSLMKIFNGKSATIIAPTASGKTLTFLLPILQKLRLNPQPFFAMVLAPTRELAYQIHEQFECYARIFSLYSTLLIGGNRVTESGAFDGSPYIIIGTAGRLCGLMELYSEEQLKYKFRNFQFLVLDEADMFMYGNHETNKQLTKILSILPSSKQVVLTTATYSSTLREFTESRQKQEKLVLIEAGIRKIPENIQHNYIFIAHQRYKLPTLLYILQCYTGLQIYQQKDDSVSLNPVAGQIMIFAHDAEQVEVVQRVLNQLKLKTVMMHGSMKQEDRLLSLSQFRGNQAQILVCTDIAARGLDIPTVELLVQMNTPAKLMEFQHRTGRVGRNRQEARQILLVEPMDMELLQAYQDEYSINITELLTYRDWTRLGKELKFDMLFAIKSLFGLSKQCELRARFDMADSGRTIPIKRQRQNDLDPKQ